MLRIICHLQCDRQEMSVCNGKVTVAVINPVYIQIKTKYQQRTSDDRVQRCIMCRLHRDFARDGRDLSFISDFLLCSPGPEVHA